MFEAFAFRSQFADKKLSIKIIQIVLHANILTFVHIQPSEVDWFFFPLVNMDPEKRHYGTFSPTETGKEPNQASLNVTSANSLSSCALQCLKDVLLCVSVAYNSATGSCSFYRDFFFPNLSSSPNTNIYVLQPYWVHEDILIVLVSLNIKF